MLNMLHLFTEYYVKRAHPNCIDIVAIRKIGSMDGDWKRALHE
jgi:hypothetical protein